MKKAVSVCTLLFAFHTLNAAVTSDQIEFLYRQTKALAARNLSCDSNQDCTVVPVRQKACGGPLEWTVISKKSPDYQSLLNKIRTLGEQQLQYLHAHPKPSPCFELRPPESTCGQGRCIEVPEEGPVR